MHKQERPKYDVVVLNSVANIHKAMPFISSHTDVYTYLDNDEAGRKTTETIREGLQNGQRLYDRSEVYTGYKDLNDYLRGKMMRPQERTIKKPRMKLR